jgi:methyltransferase (TIGR00027 family)
MSFGPEKTAERTALWRALHVQIDAPPHAIEDELGLQLLGHGESWRQRPDMDPQRSRTVRTSIASRQRFVEDLVEQKLPAQYVILGAGLDTFAQRRPELASRLRVFEVDQPGPQEWKRQRLIELGFGVPSYLRFVPVNFEKDSWMQRLEEHGFDRSASSLFVSTGVSMYLTREAIAAMLRQIASLSRTTLAMTFLRKPELLEPEERALLVQTMGFAKAAGTPFISLFAPDELVALARECGFASAQYVSADFYIEHYFANRQDGLAPGHGEEMLVASR